MEINYKLQTEKKLNKLPDLLDNVMSAAPTGVATPPGLPPPTPLLKTESFPREVESASSVPRRLSPTMSKRPPLEFAL